MNQSQRVLLWIAASGLLWVWAFPAVETTYYFWAASPSRWVDVPAEPLSRSKAVAAPAAANAAIPAPPKGFTLDQPNIASLSDIVEEGFWTQFSAVSTHELISNAHHGRIEPAYAFDDEGLIQLAKRGVRFSCYGGCEKRTRIVWQSSLVYTILIALIAGGGLWALKSSEARSTL